MTQAIRFHQTGGPEVLQMETVDVGDPGPGQARVRHTYIAVNFIDMSLHLPWRESRKLYSNNRAVGFPPLHATVPRLASLSRRVDFSPPARANGRTKVHPTSRNAYSCVTN